MGRLEKYNHLRSLPIQRVSQYAKAVATKYHRISRIIYERPKGSLAIKLAMRTSYKRQVSLKGFVS